MGNFLKNIHPLLRRSKHKDVYDDSNFAVLNALNYELTLAERETIESKIQSSLETATGEYLDEWGDWFGVYRKDGWTDDYYRSRIIRELLLKRGTIPAIIDAIKDFLEDNDANIDIYEPWRNIFYTNKSKLNGEDHLMGYYYRFAIIDITIDRPFSPAIVEVIQAFKPAGVLFYLRLDTSRNPNNTPVDSPYTYLDVTNKTELEQWNGLVYDIRGNINLSNQSDSTVDSNIFYTNRSMLNGKDVLAGAFNHGRGYIHLASDVQLSPYKPTSETTLAEMKSALGESSQDMYTATGNTDDRTAQLNIPPDPAKGEGYVWANSADGYQDFTTVYPRENHFINTSLEITNIVNEFLNSRYWDMAPLIDKHGTDRLYTVSFDLKSTIPGTVRVYSLNGSKSRYHIGQVAFPTTTEYTRFSYTFQPKLQHEDDPTAYLAFYGTYDTGVFPIVKNIKFELGDEETLYIPNKADGDYSKFMPMKYFGIPSDENYNYLPNSFSYGEPWTIQGGVIKVLPYNDTENMARHMSSGETVYIRCRTLEDIGFDFRDPNQVFTCSVWAKGANNSTQTIAVTLSANNLIFQPQQLTDEWKQYTWTFSGIGEPLSLFRFIQFGATPDAPVDMRRPRVEKNGDTRKDYTWYPTAENNAYVYTTFDVRTFIEENYTKEYDILATKLGATEAMNTLLSNPTISSRIKALISPADPINYELSIYDVEADNWFKLGESGLDTNYRRFNMVFNRAVDYINNQGLMFLQLEFTRRGQPTLVELDMLNFTFGYRLGKGYTIGLQSEVTTISEVPATGVTAEDITVGIGERPKLVTTLLPANATITDLEYVAENPQIAFVDDEGTVIPNKVGQTLVTVYGDDRRVSATCTVTVVIRPTEVKLDKNVLNLESKKQVNPNLLNDTRFNTAMDITTGEMHYYSQITWDTADLPVKRTVLKPSTTYTFSWKYAHVSGVKPAGMFVSMGYGDAVSTFSKDIFRVPTTGYVDRGALTFTTDTNITDNPYLGIRFNRVSVPLAQAVTSRYWDIKLEEGTEATPWVPVT